MVSSLPGHALSVVTGLMSFDMALACAISGVARSETRLLVLSKILKLRTILGTVRREASKVDNNVRDMSWLHRT